MLLPKVRTENIIEQNYAGEILIYDLKTHKAFSLNETAAIIYNACNSHTTFDELISLHNFSEDFIYLALDELNRHKLIIHDNNYASPFVGKSRREIIRQVGLASMIMLPMISSITAPNAAMAASGSTCPNPTTCLCMGPLAFGATCGAGSPNSLGYPLCMTGCSCRVNFPNCMNSQGFCTGVCS